MGSFPSCSWNREERTHQRLQNSLLLLQTEEDRQLAKESLMKQHIGSSKQRAALQAQTCSCSHSSCDTSSMDEQKRQVKKLQEQMSALLAKTTHTTASPMKRSNFSNLKASNGKTQSTRPRAGFCFRCGEDSHVATSCRQPANPSLVKQKRLLLHQNRSVLGQQK